MQDQETIPELSAELQRVGRTNGSKKLVLTGLRQYKVGAPTRRAGRGDSNDLVMLDEIREQRDWETWAASVASTNAKPNGLVVCFSNAGDPDSVVLRQLRSQAIALIEGTTAGDFGGDVDGATLGLFEWSAEDGAATDDIEAIAQANPALGYGYLTERALMSNRQTFPENKYLHMEKITSRKTEYTDYVYTADGDFAELAYEVEETGTGMSGGFDKRLLAGGSSRLSFEKNADGTFMKISGGLTYPGLGSFDVKTYGGQMIAENNVGEDVLNSIKALDGKKFLLVGDKYSSSNYESAAIARFSIVDEMKGYVFLNGNGADFLLKISDSKHLVSPKNIPSSSSRDLLDITLDTDENGRVTIKTSFGTEYILAENIPEFDASVKSVELTENAAWYSISDSIANTPVTVTRPENSAVIVFNKFDEPIYTSHVKDAGNVIPMPKGGRVLFLGNSGSRFTIAV
ncbi:hypothetical protein [uncultured Ruminococcus sp.]|uniref:hypothetical protein n=1 Tax=uncultured Ruminococcus sp. TaxID=165186 RepID=UPI0025F9AB89|nr:hypothetical protein [uncultured Ruminococcus sp.]